MADIPTETPLARVLDELRAIGDYDHPGGGSSALRRSTLDPPVPYSREQIEQSLQVTLPPDVIALWERASRVRLFEDVKNGQYGIVLAGAADVQAWRQEKESYWRDDLRRGDLILGQLLGTPDLLLLRCDAAAPDFGAVVIALAIAHRGTGEWFIAAPSLAEFLERYAEAHGEDFWDEDGGPLVTPRM